MQKRNRLLDFSLQASGSSFKAGCLFVHTFNKLKLVAYHILMFCSDPDGSMVVCYFSTDESVIWGPC